MADPEEKEADLDLDAKHDILREIYYWKGAFAALCTEDPDQWLREEGGYRGGYDRWAKSMLTGSEILTVAHFEGVVTEYRERAYRKAMARQNDPVTCPWPEPGTKVWVPWEHTSYDVTCKACKGQANVVVDGATFRCTTCYGQGIKKKYKATSIEATVIRVGYARSGGAEGWGKVTPDLHVSEIRLWYIDVDGAKFIGTGLHVDHMSRTKEECDVIIEKHIVPRKSDSYYTVDWKRA